MQFTFWDRESFFENVLLPIYPSHYFTKTQYLRLFDQIYLSLTEKTSTLNLRLLALSVGKQF
jgi:hypothetical protein